MPIARASTASTDGRSEHGAGMEIALSSLAFLIAALCAGTMGFAIQRGATCTVAAVDEVVSKRRFNRMTAIVEASIWVAGGLALAETFHLLGVCLPGTR